MNEHVDNRRDGASPAGVSIVRAATHDAAATQALASRFASILVNGDLIVLAGDLGAGKTCFTQGLGRGLGIDERITSPTFTIHSRYEGRLTLNHLDVYRIDQLEDTLDLDLPELLESGVTVIEWGEQIDPVLPAHLVVRISFGEGDDDRVLAFEAPSDSSWPDRLAGDALAASWLPC